MELILKVFIRLPFGFLKDFLANLFYDANR